MNQLASAKRCTCRRNPILTFGTNNYRIVCKHCGIGTEPSISIPKAIERWNERKIQQLPLLPGQMNLH